MVLADGLSASVGAGMLAWVCRCMKMKGEYTMKKALIIANMLLASATVWGMNPLSNDSTVGWQSDGLRLVYATDNDNFEEVKQIFYSQSRNDQIISLLCEEKIYREQEKKMPNKRFFLHYKNIVQNPDIVNFHCENGLVGPDNVHVGAGATPLHIAISNKNKTIGEFLIEHGANIDEKDDEGKTPLICAVGRNDTDFGKCLIENGANVNETDKYGFSVLDFAVERDNVEFIKYLIEKGINVDAYVCSLNTYLLLYAIGKNDISLVKSLIDHGANVNIGEEDKRTPLLLALRQKNQDLIELLIKKGANVNVKDIVGQTPIFSAVSFDEDPSLALYLLEHGATGVQEEVYGDSPWSLALKKEKNEMDTQKKAEWTKVVEKMKEIIEK